jgi:hypothetical protein
MAIEKKMVKSAQVIIFNVISLMQQWRVLLQDKEQKLVMVAIKMLKKKTGQVTEASLTLKC